MIVSIDILFSHNNMIGSKLIVWGSHHLAKEIPKTSHVALLVNKRWVHEATGAGVHVSSYDLWASRQTEVARVEQCPIEYKELADQFRMIQGKKYDYPGVFFLGLAIIPTFFGFDLPKKNLWESKNKYFCCEAVGYLTGHYYGMSSPVQILKALNGK
jgi:hypothetical protein